MNMLLKLPFLVAISQGNLTLKCEHLEESFIMEDVSSQERLCIVEDVTSQDRVS